MSRIQALVLTASGAARRYERRSDRAFRRGTVYPAAALHESARFRHASAAALRVPARRAADLAAKARLLAIDAEFCSPDELRAFAAEVAAVLGRRARS